MSISGWLDVGLGVWWFFVAVVALFAGGLIAVNLAVARRAESERQDIQG